MPSDLWDESKSDPRSIRHTLKFRRSIVSGDWTRLGRYASRIRILRLGTQFLASSATCHIIQLTEVDPEVFRSLSIYRPPGVLFPKLRHLHLSAYSGTLFPFVHLFLHTNLFGLHVTVPVHIPVEEQTLFLDCLTSASPALVELQLINPVSVLELERICDLHHLQDLTLGLSSLSTTELNMLAQLTSLVSLKIDTQQIGDITVARLRSLCHDPFVSLRNLTTRGLDFESCSALLLWISPNHLQELACLVDESIPVSIAAFEGFIHAITQSCSQDSLSALRIHDGSIEPMASAYRVHATSLRPLLVFKNLTTVDIDPPIFIVMDDDILQEMALAWPELQILTIGLERYSGHGYRVTLPGLIPLVEHCPRLRSLGVVLHASTQIDEEKPANGISVSCLDSLRFGRSSINPNRATEIAAFLSALFPNVRWGVSAWDDPLTDELDAEVAEDIDDCEMRDTWREVSRLYPMLAMVREQEQRQWQK